MELHDVKTKEQFMDLYREKNLQTCAQKIAYLIAAMKIRAMRCDEAETEAENLAGLEEVALLGYWKAS